MIPRVLQPAGGVSDPVRSADMFRRIAGFIDMPVCHCSCVAGTEAANVIRLTFQVRNRLDIACPGRFIVALWITGTADGDPVNTQTVTLITGTLFEGIIANQSFLYLTDANGALVLDVTIAGAATRYAHTLVLPEPATSGVITWT